MAKAAGGRLGSIRKRFGTQASKFLARPAIVCNDVFGGDALELGKREWRDEGVLGPR